VTNSWIYNDTLVTKYRVQTAFCISLRSITYWIEKEYSGFQVGLNLLLFC